MSLCPLQQAWTGSITRTECILTGHDAQYSIVLLSHPYRGATPGAAVTQVCACNKGVVMSHCCHRSQQATSIWCALAVSAPAQACHPHAFKHLAAARSKGGAMDGHVIQEDALHLWVSHAIDLHARRFHKIVVRRLSKFMCCALDHRVRTLRTCNESACTALPAPPHRPCLNRTHKHPHSRRTGTVSLVVSSTSRRL